MTNLLTAKRNACVIVLGDIGRSPRMQYHVVSLLEENYNVDVIGYVETNPLLELSLSEPKCKIIKLTPAPTMNLSRILTLIIKTIWQTLSLLFALFSVRKPNFLLVQNPPGIPTLIVSVLYCALTRTPFIIDWHNYTYTILGLSMENGENNMVCRIAKRVENFFGSKADANFCVTKAMKKDLFDNWNIKNVIVFHDRPHSQFNSVDLATKHDLFMKLSKEYAIFLPNCYEDIKKADVIESTALTQKLSDGKVVYKQKRIALLASSTSWTPDEDFSLLLAALHIYDKKASMQSERFPYLLCIITGKGPQKEEYQNEIRKLNFSKVGIITPWLEMQDYPVLLAAADLGVSLHWSSSGLDLPMKIVDMFGCGLPVCAYNFKCLNELVLPGKNGFIFENSQELAEQLLYWFENFPKSPSRIESRELFRENLKSFQNFRWRENWITNALPVFNSFI